MCTIEHSPPRRQVSTEWETTALINTRLLRLVMWERSLKEFSIWCSIHVAKNKLSVSNSCLCGCCCCCNYQLARSVSFKLGEKALKWWERARRKESSSSQEAVIKRQPFLVPDSIAKRTAPTHTQSQLLCFPTRWCTDSWLLLLQLASERWYSHKDTSFWHRQ